MFLISALRIFSTRRQRFFPDSQVVTPHKNVSLSTYGKRTRLLRRNVNKYNLFTGDHVRHTVTVIGDLQQLFIA